MLAITAMAPQFAYHQQKLQPDSTVLRIHVLHVMKRKPHLHDGTVNTDKNGLVEIRPSGYEPPDGGLTRIW